MAVQGKPAPKEIANVRPIRPETEEVATAPSAPAKNELPQTPATLPSVSTVTASKLATEAAPKKKGWLTESQKEFLHDHKGAISLTISAIVFATSYLLPQGPQFWVRAAGEAALIGSLVDFMAIKMLFERYPFLPGSGVIPRNREKIINGLAESVEKEWLTPESIKGHFAGLDLGSLVRSGLNKLKDDDDLLKMILHEVSTNGVSWVDNHQFLDFLAKKIREKVGRLGHLAHNVGVVDFDEIAVDVAENIANEIKHLPENEQLKTLIRDELAKISDQTSSSMTVSVRIERIKDAIIDSLFGQLEGRIATMVKENLSTFTDDEIRHMFESKTRRQLEWIRVNGALYGALFGLILAAINRYFGAGH